jgi:hypothetical protein
MQIPFDVVIDKIRVHSTIDKGFPYSSYFLRPRCGGELD